METRQIAHRRQIALVRALRETTHLKWTPFPGQVDK